MDSILDYFYLSAFDFEVITTEISKYILHFFLKKHNQKQGRNYQINSLLLNIF